MVSIFVERTKLVSGVRFSTFAILSAKSSPLNGVFKRPFIATLFEVGSSPVSISISNNFASCALLPTAG